MEESIKSTPTEDVFYNRLLEIEGVSVLNADRLQIRMAPDVMFNFVQEALNGGTKIRKTKQGWTKYHPDGFIDFRIQIDYKLPVGTFVIRLIAL